MTIQYFFEDYDGNEFNGNTKLSEIRKHFIDIDITSYMLTQVTSTILLQYNTENSNGAYGADRNFRNFLYDIFFFLILKDLKNNEHDNYVKNVKTISLKRYTKANINEELKTIIIDDTSIDDLKNREFKNNETVDDVFNVLKPLIKDELTYDYYSNFGVIGKRTNKMEGSQLIELIECNKTIYKDEIQAIIKDLKTDELKNDYYVFYKKVLFKALLKEYPEIKQQYRYNYQPAGNTSQAPQQIESIEKAIDSGKKQIILTGAPGTGKTFSVLNFAQLYTKANGEYKFIQFHSSYDYTDFVEGLKPIETTFTDAAGNTQTKTEFRRIDGVFKKFCRDAQAQLDMTFITNKAADIKNKSDKTLYEEAIKETPCIFVIDEINRADLSRVFGELMYSLEENYRGKGHKIATQYQGLPTYDMNGEKLEDNGEDIFKDGFYIPENVIIIGTMNDIDRNVETFDFALRRRFRFIEINANDSIKGLYDKKERQNQADPNAYDKEYMELFEKVACLNAVVKKERGKAFQLGRSYFSNYYNDDSKSKYFENELEGILREYVRGKKEKEIQKFIDACKEAFNNKKFEGLDDEEVKEYDEEVGELKKHIDPNYNANTSNAAANTQNAAQSNQSQNGSGNG